MLHKIARNDGSPADPRDNNLTSNKVAIVSQELRASEFDATFVVNEKTGGVSGGLPSGAIYLYVFEW